jgi:hypothetical protein
MTVCFMHQEMQSRLHLGDEQDGEIGALLDDVQVLLGKVR